MRLLLRTIVLAAAVAAPAAAAPVDDLRAVVRDHQALEARADPVSAGFDGDRAALRLWPDHSPPALAARRTALEALDRRLKALAAAPLPAEDALNRDLLRRTVDEDLTSLGFDEARLQPVDALNSLPSGVTSLATSTRVRDADDADAWLARLAALPDYYARETDNLRRGITTGFVQPRPVAQVVLAVSQAQLAVPVEQDPLLKPFAVLPASIAAPEQARLRARAAELVRTRVRPAQAAFARFMRDDYLPHARTGLAARDLPDGERYYAFVVRRHTTTNLTPDQIHALGEREVARVRAQMEQLVAGSGSKGSFAQFQAHLRTDPRYYARSREELLERAALTAKQIDAVLPQAFDTLPRQPFTVVPVPADQEESQTTAYYQQGAPAVGRTGAYTVNLSHLDQRPLYELPVLTAHEAEPGHHLQIALAQERLDLPRFRRDAYITAYAEGWALYSERLAGDLGMYRTPEERFGALSYEMWRACRLVADTGIHWMRWSKEQARACFTDNTALSAKNIDVELDRYVSWPGQALAYKTGQLKILELRDRARTALGPRFDLRRFHDAVLLDGPLPLDLLETRIDAWIAAERARPAA